MYEMNNLIIYNNAEDNSLIGLIDDLKINNNITIFNNDSNTTLPTLSSDLIKFYTYDIRSPQSLFRLNQFYIQNLKVISEVAVLINCGSASYVLPQFYISRIFINNEKIFYREMDQRDDLRIILSDPNFDGQFHSFDKEEMGNFDGVYRVK